MRGVRMSLKYAMEKMGEVNKAAEIGCRVGNNAATMLENGVKFLYLIDNYPRYEETWEGKNGVKRVVVTEDNQRLAKKTMLRKLESYNGRKTFIEMPSVEAAKTFDDGSLDYVYIDGNHDFEFVRQDLEAWFPKVREGGVFAGHDYTATKFPGVIEAVNEFANKHNKKVVINRVDSDWWIK